MSRIEKISHVRDLGIFRSFDWPGDLYTFSRFNLIYGWNGSGKTTLSKLFRALEMKKIPTVGQATFIIDGKRITHENFSKNATAIRVFNRDFVTANVFPVGGGDVPPIFVVGSESVEKQKQIESLKGKLAQVQRDLDSEQSSKQKLDSELNKFCSDHAKAIKDMLRSSGHSQYNNYNKSDYKKSADNMVEWGNKDAMLLSESNHDKLLAQLTSNLKQKLQLNEFRFPEPGQLAKSVSKLLAREVVADTMQSLKDDMMVAQWVQKGLDLHHDRQTERCLFCEQSIPMERLIALEAHFNSEYVEFLKDLESQIDRLKKLKNEANSTKWPNHAELYDDLADEYEAYANSLSKVIGLLQDYIDSMIRILVEKKSRIFESVDFDIPLPDCDATIVDKMNELILKHNEVCDDFQNRMNEARQRLEANSVAQQLDEYLQLKNGIQLSEDSIKGDKEETTQLSQRISTLEREIVLHRQPAEELNKDLSKYLGHDELQLMIKETGYSITRNGYQAEGLSEGEMTALALLYFLKSLQDRSFDLKKGIVVLDDPVSSLDANALYLAFGFIRDRTRDAAQLFIFTHNFALFREVKTWFHHLKGQNKRDVNKRPARFYMLECIRNGTLRCSFIRPLDRLLEEYESEYHFIFASIYRAAGASSPSDLAEKYVLPNMARRLLEAFLAFRQPDISGELWEKMKNIEFDEAKKMRILRFLNVHSHSDSIGEPEHDLSILSEAGPVLRDLLEFIKNQDNDHYTSMVSLINSSAEGSS